MKINGSSVVKGIAVGKALVITNNYQEKMSQYRQEDKEKEMLKYVKASKQAGNNLKQLLDKKTLSENEEEILKAHQMILEDFTLIEAIKRCIEEGSSAPKAVLQAVAEMEKIFSSIEDPYLRERAADVKDVGNRLLRILLQINEFEINGEDVIIYAEDMEPSMMAGLPSTKVKGVLLGNGSKTSHAVIIAKAKGFVTMVGVELSENEIQDGDTLVVDGDNQFILVNPPEDIVVKYRVSESEQGKEKAHYLEKAGLPAKTGYGKEVLVAANISQPHEIDDIGRFGCQGVGLYRTEFLFMQNKQLPTEEEQFEAYKYVAENAKGNLCVIRTLDIGGDKPLEALNMEKEDNPFLGFRAIRICLQNKELFIRQIKAILRAGAFGRVAIMIPMVISLKEITETKKIVAEAMAELDKENKPYKKQIPIGIMVETPAAAIMAPVLAQHVDFFSIGTNDLVQYTLAVDRGNQKVSYLYDYFNPAVIHSIYQTVQAAHKWNKWVGICGEMASDELGVPLLLALDVDELSMSASLAPKIKERVRRANADSCDVGKILAMTDAEEIRAYLAKIVIRE